ncbi:MAG: peroxiredoxin family protein [Chloroflexota bacterium]
MQGPWIAVFVAQWVLLVFLTVLVAGVLRYLGAIQERLTLAAPHISRYELGDAIDSFTLPTIDGEELRTQDLLRGPVGALIFLLSPSCPACKTMVAQVAEVAERPDRLAKLGWSIAVVTSGERKAVEEMRAAYPGLMSPGVFVLYDPDASVLRRFGVGAVPTGMAVDTKGRVVRQSLNPHQNWLYKMLDVLPPSEPVRAESARNMDPLIIHESFLQDGPMRVGPPRSTGERR